MSTPFKFIGIRYRCKDCTGGVGDRNGILVINQVEAHLKSYPEHTVELERTGLDHRKLQDD